MRGCEAARDLVLGEEAHAFGNQGRLNDKKCRAGQ